MRDSKRKYPPVKQVLFEPRALDGYVFANHYPKSISANALVLRDRSDNREIEPPKAFASDESSTQERGILRGIIALFDMSGEDSDLIIYTTSHGVKLGLSGTQNKLANRDLVAEIQEIAERKRIRWTIEVPHEDDLARQEILKDLKRRAKAERDKKLGESEKDDDAA